MALPSRYAQLLCMQQLAAGLRCVSARTLSHETKFHIPRQVDYEVKQVQETKVPLHATEVVTKTTTQVNNLRVIAMKRKLFTPGPLMVSNRVKMALLTDVGGRHAEFSYITKYIREALLQIAKVNSAEYTSILLDGSGTAATEATMQSIMGKKNKKLLIMENGLYGERLAEICQCSGIKYKKIPMDVKALQETLLANNDISGVMVVHCETSSGMVNPVNEIGRVVKKCSPDCLFLVDAMTSFGAIAVDMKNVDFLISNSCKILQGAPGVSFVIAHKEMLQKNRCKGVGLVLDIGAQYDELEKTGHFLFTPPTYVMNGFKEALMEYSEEGSIKARFERYQQNTKILKEEMAIMGFKQLLRDEENPLGCIVTCFKYPNTPRFVFDEFYKRLTDYGHLISIEKITARKCFRIGTIGHMYPDDVKELAISIRDVCQDMRMDLPLTDFNVAVK